MQALHYPPTLPVRSAVPTFEPITLDEAKKQCELGGTGAAHESQLTGLIALAREQVERDALLICCTGTFTIKRTCWTDGRYSEWFELPSSLRPVSSITSIAYLDTDGDSQTWSSTEYTLDTYSIAPLVRLNYDYTWPSLRGDYNGITITAVAGYASQSVVPQRVKQACLLKLHELWLTSHEMPAESQANAYDVLVASLRREVYA